MNAGKSRYVLGILILLGLAIPTPADALPRAGGHHHQGGTGVPRGRGWQGWSWGWTIGDYPSGWSVGYAGDWQQGYAAGVMQAQWAAQQQRQAELMRLRQPQPKNPEHVVKPQPEAVRPTPPAVPPPVYTPAERAAAKLKLATLLAADGKAGDAADFYAAIVKDYPGTPAARQAEAALDQVNHARRVRTP